MSERLLKLLFIPKSMKGWYSLYQFKTKRISDNEGK